MMINRRLLALAPESRRYIAASVVLQWLSLVANISLMAVIAELLAAALLRQAPSGAGARLALVAMVALVVRHGCTLGIARMQFLSAATVKRRLRRRIYEKLLRLGPSYQEQVRSSEVVQITVEGVDQLETYFGAYLPQFFYAMLAPLTLFVVLARVNFWAALVLLVGVPLIPIAIACVQTWAKKLLGDYWTQYADLGDRFLENLQGLTTLKIYQVDEYKNEEMNQEAEAFRRITMKVLVMQLNSISVMDLVAYGGAALGMIVALMQFASGNVSLAGCLLIMLLAADFFLPMRQLGSFFHVAMNGMAASEKILRLLDVPERERGRFSLSTAGTICIQDLCYAYDGARAVLKDVEARIAAGTFTAIVGASGCGKSTLAGILSGRLQGFAGEVTIDGEPLGNLSEENLMRQVTLVGHRSMLFKGSVRENLRMAAPNASDEQLWHVLERVQLAAFLDEQEGLETLLLEGGANFSGGQRQRLALARALLHDSPVYIFDEATSNIDVESEEAILREIHALAKKKTVIMISHRLANVVAADEILVMASGCVVERGQHASLLARQGVYHQLWQAQQQLEQFGLEVEQNA